MDFYFNNEFHDINDAVLVSDHRAVFFGDGLFETIRVFNKSIPFIEDHMNRMLAGMQLLGMDIPEHFTSTYFVAKISELLHRNAFFNARVRITVMRRGKGRYGPQKRSVDWMMHSEALESADFELNERGLQMTVFDQIKKPRANISNIKSTSSAIYTMAAIYKKQMSKDDCILLNEFGRVAEAHASNIFGIQKGVIHTPAISEACVAGVMRKNLIELIMEHGYEVFEEEMELDGLQEMDSVFITNSIQGIQWVESIDTNMFEIGEAHEVVKILNQAVSTI